MAATEASHKIDDNDSYNRSNLSAENTEECEPFPVKTKINDGGKVYKCPFCEKVLKSRNCLYKHKKRKHDYKPEMQSNVQCSMCKEFSCNSLVELAGHLSEYHKKETTVVDTKFESYEEFVAWKKDIEKGTNALFVQHRQARKNVKHTTAWFYCNRTGTARRRGEGKRCCKTLKIDEKCSAFMRATISNDTNEVLVKYSLSHLGHDAELEDAGITKQLKRKRNSCEELRNNISGIVDEFLNRMQECKNRIVLKEARAHLSNALNTLTGISTANETAEIQSAVRNIPLNAPATGKQSKFTNNSKNRTTLKKKSWTTSKSTLNSEDEEMEVQETLEETVVNICGICFQENDGRNHRIVNWLQCAGCGVMLHKTCHTEHVDGEDDYCSLCRQEMESSS
eukprot:gene640-1308_t